MAVYVICARRGMQAPPRQRLQMPTRLHVTKSTADWDAYVTMLTVASRSTVVNLSVCLNASVCRNGGPQFRVVKCHLGPRRERTLMINQHGQ